MDNLTKKIAEIKMFDETILGKIEEDDDEVLLTELTGTKA